MEEVERMKERRGREAEGIILGEWSFKTRSEGSKKEGRRLKNKGGKWGRVKEMRTRPSFHVDFCMFY